MTDYKADELIAAVQGVKARLWWVCFWLFVLVTGVPFK